MTKCDWSEYKKLMLSELDENKAFRDEVRGFINKSTTSNFKTNTIWIGLVTLLSTSISSIIVLLITISIRKLFTLGIL